MAGNRTLRVNVRIQQSANHALAWRLVLCCLGLEKLDAALAQCQRNFHAVFPKRQFRGGRQKIRDHFSQPGAERARGTLPPSSGAPTQYDTDQHLIRLALRLSQQSVAAPSQLV